MAKLTLQCVGMRHHATPHTYNEISAACPLKVEIRREPDNLRDKNALAVLCLEKPWRGMKLGYVAKETAAVLSPRMDKGLLKITESWLAKCDELQWQGEMIVTTLKIGSTKPKNSS